MNMQQMIAKASQFIVIHDGDCRYPVLRADVRGSGETLASLQAMDGEDYSAWCNTVGYAGPHVPGTIQCHQLCEELADAGAPEWYL